MNRVTIVAIVVGVIVIIGLIALIVTGGVRQSATTGPAGGVGVGESANSVQSSTSTSASATHAPVPANVVVPDKGAQNVPANIAVPQVQAPAAPGVTASLRSFSITETADAYTPNTVVVKQDDTVDMLITASGGNYDFAQPDTGLSLAIPAGTTKKVEFQAVSTGKFTFYCPSCGGPAKGPVGYIIVANK